MAKYRVLELLTSLSTGQYIQPGEVIEIDDDQAAAILLDKKVIEPAKATIKGQAKTTLSELPEADKEK